MQLKFKETDHPGYKIIKEIDYKNVINNASLHDMQHCVGIFATFKIYFGVAFF